MFKTLDVNDDSKTQFEKTILDATYHYYPNYPMRIKRIKRISCIQIQNIIALFKSSLTSKTLNIQMMSDDET
jgi:hypothetical protein